MFTPHCVELLLENIELMQIEMDHKFYEVLIAGFHFYFKNQLQMLTDTYDSLIADCRFPFHKSPSF